MTDLPIHISTHHLQLSDALRDFVRKKIAPVNRFASDALAAEIVLRRHGGAKRRFSASARVALPGRDVYGRIVHVDLYVAICRLMRRLARLLRKRKTRLGRILERRTPTYTANQPLRQRIEKDLALTAPTRERLLRKKADTQEIRVFPFRRRAVLSPCLHAESR
jgi:ribosome hibernation promoting factor